MHIAIILLPLLSLSLLSETRFALTTHKEVAKKVKITIEPFFISSIHHHHHDHE